MRSEVKEIRERLQAVEKTIRRYRAALAIVSLIVAARLIGPSLVGATKAPETIQAKTFEVVDDNGKRRARLTIEGDGGALELGDKIGKMRVLLSTWGDAATLTLADRAGNMRALLGTEGDATVLSLHDKAGKQRAVLSTEGDSAALTLDDKAGKQRAVLGNTDLENHETGATEHRATSSLVLLNNQGRVVWGSP